MKHFQNAPMTLIASWLKIQSRDGIYDGTVRTWRYLDHCTAACYRTGTTIIFTRDAGMHSSGWWKNPDYERCYHLSLGFRDLETGEPDSKNKTLTEQWVEEFFGAKKTLLWCEPPFSDGGKRKDIWHYRLFVHSDWQTPLLPRGEVYTKTNTPANFKTWSELHQPDTLHQAAID